MLNVIEPRASDYKVEAEVLIGRWDAMFLTPDQLRSRVLKRLAQDVADTILLNIDEVPVKMEYEEGSQFLTYRLLLTLKGDIK